MGYTQIRVIPARLPIDRQNDRGEVTGPVSCANGIARKPDSVLIS